MTAARPTSATGTRVISNRPRNLWELLHHIPRPLDYHFESPPAVLFRPMSHSLLSPLSYPLYRLITWTFVLLGPSTGHLLLLPLSRFFKDAIHDNTPKRLGAAYAKAHLYAMKFFEYAMAARSGGGVDLKLHQFSAVSAGVVPWILAASYDSKRKGTYNKENGGVFAGNKIHQMCKNVVEGLRKIVEKDRDYFVSKKLIAKLKHKKYPAARIHDALVALAEDMSQLEELFDGKLREKGLFPEDLMRSAHLSRSLSGIRVSPLGVTLKILHPDKGKISTENIDGLMGEYGVPQVYASAVLLAMIKHGLCWHRNFASLANALINIAQNFSMVKFEGPFSCQFSKSGKKGVRGQSACGGIGLIINIDIPLPLGQVSSTKRPRSFLYEDAWSPGTQAGFVNELQLFHGSTTLATTSSKNRKHILLLSDFDDIWTADRPPGTKGACHLSVGMVYAPQPYVGLLETSSRTLHRTQSTFGKIAHSAWHILDDYQAIIDECRRRPSPAYLNLQLAMFGGFFCNTGAQPVLPEKSIPMGAYGRETFDLANKFKGLRLRKKTIEHTTNVETGLYASEHCNSSLGDGELCGVDPEDPILMEIEEVRLETRFISHRSWVESYHKMRLSVDGNVLRAWHVDVSKPRHDITGLQVGVEAAGFGIGLAGTRQARRISAQEEYASLDFISTPYATMVGYLAADNLFLPSSVDPRTSLAGDGYRFMVLLYAFQEKQLRFVLDFDCSWMNHIREMASYNGFGFHIQQPLPLTKVGGIAILDADGNVQALLVGLSKKITIKYSGIKKVILRYGHRGKIGACCEDGATTTETLEEAIRKEIDILGGGKARAVKRLVQEEGHEYGWLELMG